MSKMFRQALPILLAILLIFCTVSCDTEKFESSSTNASAEGNTTSNTQASTTTSETTATLLPTKPSDNTDTPTDKLVLMSDGKTNYKIIYPSSKNDINGYAKNAAFSLRNSFRQSLGVMPNVAEETASAGGCEIIVGDTDIAELGILLRANEYVIKVIDERIFIVAGSDAAISKAVNHFADTYLNKAGTKCLIPTSINVKLTDSSLPEVSEKLLLFANNEAKYQIVYPSLSNDAGLSAKAAAEKLGKAFEDKLGAAPKTICETDSTGYSEIIVGKISASPISQTITKYHYIITQVKGNIYIYATDSLPLSEAIDFFIESYIKPDSNGRCYISSSVNLTNHIETENIMEIKAATYNIHNGVDVNYDYTVIARDILAEDAEIVALQEVDQKTGRNGYIDTMSVLANALPEHKYYVFSPSINYKGGQFGNAIFSKYPILSHEIIKLPTTRDDEEERSLLHAKIDINGYILDYFVTHTDQKSINAQLTKVNEYTSKCNSFVLAGDFNVQEKNAFAPIENSHILNNDGNKIITTVSGNYSFDNFVLHNAIEAMNIYTKNTGHSDHYMFLCTLVIVTE